MKVTLKTYGCTLNQADSDIIRSILSEKGVEVTSAGKDSDVVIVNTCTVKNATSQRILDKLSQLEREGKRVIVTGCMAGANRDMIKKRAPNASIVTTQNIPGIYDAVREVNSGNMVMLERYKVSERLESLSQFGGVIAKIPVSDGCLSSCSFCETKFARGPLRSFDENTILRAAAQAAKSGAKEIQLTSQDMGAYGKDKDTDFVKLLEKISAIEGDFKVRVGMLNPEHLKDTVDGFANVIKGERFYRFVHIPVEAGSDTVLERMRRSYTVGEFEDYLARIRSEVKGVGIETDMIVGFPGESQSEFDEGIDFLKRNRFEVTNISRFGARPHASASKMVQLPQETINERSNVMSRVVRRLQREINEEYIGRDVGAIFTECTKSSMNGRTDSYRQVVWRGGLGRIGLGERRRVRIKEVSANVIYC